MEAKSKGTKVGLMTLVSVVLVGAVSVILLTGCNDKKNNASNITSNEKQQEDNKSNTTSNEKKPEDNVEYEVKNGEIEVKESSKENELALGEWGKASREVTANFSYEEYRRIGYIEVPTSVTKVIRGKEAEDIVREWYDKKPNYSYDEPKSDMEWAVIEYKVDLSDVKIKEGSDGINITLKCSLTGPGGGTAVTQGRTYLLSPYSMSDEVRAKTPAIYTGRIMVKLPIGYTDYTIQLGSTYDNTKEGNKGTIAYFKGQ